MRTDPLGDAWDFLVGAQPDQVALGDVRWVFVGLFVALLLASGVTALSVWRRQGGDPAPGPFWSWLVRVLAGIWWFQAALSALPLPVSPGVQRWTERMVDGAAWPWIEWLVGAAVLPHMEVVGPAVFAIEIGMAVSLLLGLFVRPVATFGGVCALGLWLGLYCDPDAWPWQFVMLASVHGMSAVVGGRFSLGLDALLAPLWHRRPAR